MSNDIFGFSASKGKTFVGGLGTFTVGEGSLANISLIQSWQINYNQHVTPLYEVGSNKIHFTKTHQMGTLSIGRMVSDEDVISQFGNGCDTKNATITAANGVCTGDSSGKRKFSISGLILTGVSWGGQAGQAHVSENIAASFVSLDID
jgi:hypothetical protein